MEVEDLIRELNQAAQGTDADVVDSHHTSSCQALADELLALQSIYALEDPKALRIVSLYLPTRSSSSNDVDGRSDEKKQLSHWQKGCQIRLALDLPLHLPTPSNHPDPSGTPSSLRLSITIPPSYPESQSAPQFQLLDRFIGDYEVDSSLFGQVLRTFLHHEAQARIGGVDGIRWQKGEVVLFEGCESVKELVEEWYKEQRRRGEERKRKDGRAGVGVVSTGTGEADSNTVGRNNNSVHSQRSQRESSPPPTTTSTPSPSVADETLASLIKSKRWTSTPPLVERKSTFIGHAIRLDRPEEVPLLLQGLLHLYPRMEKATHPFMRAWVCCTTEMNGERNSSSSRKVVHRDCDDDGENAAGGRLAHLLEMLHLQNVLVVVTRFYGGIQLGADRFKLINRVAREALDLAGLLTP